jgi:hypothetical protein
MVDGKYVCTLTAYCRSDLQRNFVRHEWPKILEVSTCAQPPNLAAQLSSNNPSYLSLLPEKFDPAFNTLISNLERTQTACVISLATRELYLMPSSLPTLHPQPTSAHLPSILAVTIVNKPDNHTNKPAIPKPGGVPSPSLGPQPRPRGPPPNVPTTPPPPGTAKSQLFMAGVRLAVVGVAKNDTNNLNLVNHTVGFLVQHCGAEFNEFPEPSKTNLVIVHSPYVGNLTEVPCLLDLKLDNSVRFVRGLQYLDNCCKSSQQLPISPAEKLFPSGGLIIVEASAALREDTFRRLFVAVDKQAQRQVEWKVKIERSLLPSMRAIPNDPRASRVCDVVSAYMGHKIFEVTAEEEPHSHTPANAVEGLPPLLVRTALKLAFIHASKFRHIIILTADSSLATIARRHQILAVDMEGLDLFFKAQAFV